MNNLKQLLVLLVFTCLIAVGIFALLKYFYPKEKPESPVQSPWTSTATTPTPTVDDVLGKPAETTSTVTNAVATSTIKDTTVFNTKSNLTLKDIQNTTYALSFAPQAKFVDGSYRAGSISSTITLVAFGDINKDGSGDAVVVTTTIGESTVQELHVVLNDAKLPRVLKLAVPLDLDQSITTYRKVEILDGLLQLDMNVAHTVNGECCTALRITQKYRFENTQLITDLPTVAWKKYRSDEFGFEFSYPETAPIIIRPIIENGRDLPGTLLVSISMPYVTSYNTWTKKSFTMYVTSGVCPYRNAATVIVRNGIEFHSYTPPYTETSTTEKSSVLRELMTYQGKHCFTLISKLEGPGPLSPDFPRAADARMPDNLETFFALEFSTLERLLDTFAFLL